MLTIIVEHLSMGFSVSLRHTGCFGRGDGFRELNGEMCNGSMWTNGFIGMNKGLDTQGRFFIKLNDLDS